jgi:hypothetical protein
LLREFPPASIAASGRCGRRGRRQHHRCLSEVEIACIRADAVACWLKRTRDASGTFLVLHPDITRSTFDTRFHGTALNIEIIGFRRVCALMKAGQKAETSSLSARNGRASCAHFELNRSDG